MWRGKTTPENLHKFPQAYRSIGCSQCRGSEKCSAIRLHQRERWRGNHRIAENWIGTTQTRAMHKKVKTASQKMTCNRLIFKYQPRYPHRKDSHVAHAAKSRLDLRVLVCAILRGLCQRRNQQQAQLKYCQSWEGSTFQELSNDGHEKRKHHRQKAKNGQKHEA